MIKLGLRSIVVPLTAAVIGLSAWPATFGTAGSGCLPLAARSLDPDLRAAFAAFERTQSTAAKKICAVYRNVQ